MRKSTPITYFRHVNGRGRITEDAEVSISAHLSKDSQAVERCQVRDSRIENGSIISGDARVFGGTVHRSFIGGQTVVAGNPEITRSIINNRNITGCPYLCHVVASGVSEVADSAHVQGTSLDKPIVLGGAALVYGDAYLIGSFELSGQMRVHEGTWNRTPSHIDLGFAAITECCDGKVLVDCRCRTREYWRDFGADFGRRLGWSDHQIADTLSAIKEVSRSS